MPDLVAFLAFHAGLRRDFGRLADALAACDPADAPRRALIDEHLALLLRALHHHHVIEDEEIWPLLRTLAPGAGDVMDRLHAEHREMDAVVGRLSAVGRSTGEQVDDLRLMHRLVGDHLDLEEHGMVPLIREHVAADWWEGASRRATSGYGRDLPMVAAWTVDAAGPDQRERLVAATPVILRVLYRLSWRRAYECRAAQVFG
ncbi:hypothetical protein GCM10017600_81500 [Streptosporangium carneum]|uniref:Hemerythrin-like domain-containing protein n=1 Tax=Streptosporangium carneum TaxID=47481 RepID=A0A9W6IBN6_9ACTN|nr:hypothetical protein GCM10017600_81500 [Streptosporangium carneum]